MIRATHLGKSLLIVVSFIILAGCTGYYPQPERIDFLDYNFGRAFHSAKCHQILNPYAVSNCGPVVGMTAKESEVAYEEYIKSFKEAEQPTTIINIGQ